MCCWLSVALLYYVINVSCLFYFFWAIRPCLLQEKTSHPPRCKYLHCKDDVKLRRDATYRDTLPVYAEMLCMPVGCRWGPNPTRRATPSTTYELISPVRPRGCHNSLLKEQHLARSASSTPHKWHEAFTDAFPMGPSSRVSLSRPRCFLLIMYFIFFTMPTLNSGSGCV